MIQYENTAQVGVPQSLSLISGEVMSMRVTSRCQIIADGGVLIDETVRALGSINHQTKAAKELSLSTHFD